MQSSFCILASCVFFTVNTAVARELQPRGVALYLDLSKLLLVARDPQSETFCDGITCGTSCVPTGYLCCSDGGGGCPVSSECVPNGCCPIGEHCVGGGGTMTLPGGIGPVPTFSDDSTPANTAPADSPATASSFDLSTDSSTDSFENYLATAYPSTDAAGVAIGGAWGTAAATSTAGFTGDALSSSTTTSSSSSRLVASSATPGSSSGGSSSSGSNNKASGATETVSKSTVLSGLVVLVGLILVQML